MSTRSISSMAPTFLPSRIGAGFGAERSCPNRIVRFLLLGGMLAPLTSCGMSQGSLLYLLGVGRGQKVEARFRLTDGPLLILLDDASHRIDWPPAKRYLFDELAQELLKHEAAAKIIPSETIAHLRQGKADFDRRGCREVGRMAGADQVLWIEVQDFRASEQIEDALVAAYFNVTLKVVNVNATERAGVRAWPVAPRGQVVVITLSGSEVSIAKTRNGIAKKLAAKLATQTAKFFYDFRLGDFEQAP